MSTGTPIPQPSMPGDFDSTVLLIRHGESAAVVPGSAESHDPPLSETGARQAAALADRLDGVPIDGVYASDYRRAADTARPLAERRGLDVTERRDLREVFLGDWEGGGFRRRAADLDPEFLAFAAAGRWEVIPGAEADEALRARVTAAVADIVAAHRGGVAAVVAHSGWINAWLAAHWEAPRSLVVTIDNTSLTELRAGDGGRYLVAGINDRHHLGDPLRVSR